MWYSLQSPLYFSSSITHLTREILPTRPCAGRLAQRPSPTTRGSFKTPITHPGQGPGPAVTATGESRARRRSFNAQVLSGDVSGSRDTLSMELPSETPADEQHTVVPLSYLGERWSAAEYAQLAEEIRSGLTVDKIAQTHGRPSGGITSACNRLLPTEQRPSSCQHAPAALNRFLHEHPDEPLAIGPATPRRPRKQPREEVTPLPGPTRHGLGSNAQLESGDAASLTSEAISRLEGRSREQQILRMRVGFEDAPHTLAEIAEEFGLSRERIRQIEARALTLLVRQARKPGTPGATLAALLHLPDNPDALDEAFAERIATIVAAEFVAPTRVAIPLLLCAAGVGSPTARRVAVLARAAEERRRELEKEQRRTAAAERRAATAARRAEEVLARWIEHAAWPADLESPPERGTPHPLRLDGPGEPAGSFYSSKLDREVLYESSLEFSAFTVLENSTDIAWYQEQPLIIPYTWEGRQRLYYPDILAATHKGRCLLIEAKPLTSMPVALNRAKATAARAYAHRNGLGVGYRRRRAHRTRPRSPHPPRRNQTRHHDRAGGVRPPGLASRPRTARQRRGRPARHRRLHRPDWCAVGP